MLAKNRESNETFINRSFNLVVDKWLDLQDMQIWENRSLSNQGITNSLENLIKREKNTRCHVGWRYSYMVWNDKNAVGPTMMNPNPGIHRFWVPICHSILWKRCQIKLLPNGMCQLQNPAKMIIDSNRVYKVITNSFNPWFLCDQMGTWCWWLLFMEWIWVLSTWHWQMACPEILQLHLMLKN